VNETGIIILAAGSSSRLGKPKQLLSYQNKSLIEHITGEAVKANLHPIVIVTGANAEQVSLALNKKDEEIVYNEHWQQGMASSIVAGISKMLLLDDDVEAALIAVCDQPFVTAELLQALINKKAETGKGIVACTYADTAGTPVLFDRKYFIDLQQLKGEEGAKKLLKLYEADLVTVSFPQGSIDIDTEADYKALK
jgi:molybdenum cofactor cytidylyltransferase